jgi:hypothetical protein
MRLRWRRTTKRSPRRARHVAEAATEAIAWLGEPAKVREEAQAIARDFRKFARRARKLEAAPPPDVRGGLRPQPIRQELPDRRAGARGQEPSPHVRRRERSTSCATSTPRAAGGDGPGHPLHPAPAAALPGGRSRCGCCRRPTSSRSWAIPSSRISTRRKSTFPRRSSWQSHCAASPRGPRRAGRPADRGRRRRPARVFRGPVPRPSVVRALGSAFWAQAAAHRAAPAGGRARGFFGHPVERHAGLDRRAREPARRRWPRSTFPTRPSRRSTRWSPARRAIIDVGRTLGGLGDPADGRQARGGARRGPRRRCCRAPRSPRWSRNSPSRCATSPGTSSTVTDLLDFPGARSREKLTPARRVPGEKGKLPGLFLRGKVAYLYQRYCAEQESPPCCCASADSNQEVRTLPR